MVDLFQTGSSNSEMESCAELTVAETHDQLTDIEESVVTQDTESKIISTLLLTKNDDETNFHGLEKTNIETGSTLLLEKNNYGSSVDATEDAEGKNVCKLLPTKKGNEADSIEGQSTRLSQSVNSSIDIQQDESSDRKANVNNDLVDSKSSMSINQSNDENTKTDHSSINNDNSKSDTKKDSCNLALSKFENVGSKKRSSSQEKPTARSQDRPNSKSPEEGKRAPRVRRQSMSASRNRRKSASQERRRSRSRDKRQSASRDRRRSRSRDKEKSASRERRRSRSRDKRKSASRERRKSRSRDKRKSASRDRRRSRSRDKEKSASRERRRSRSRDKRKSASRERRRSRSRDKRKSASRDRRRPRSRDKRKSASRERRRSRSGDKRNAESRGRQRSRSQVKRKAGSRERRRSVSRDKRRSVSRNRRSRRSTSRNRLKSTSVHSVNLSPRRPIVKDFRTASNMNTFRAHIKVDRRRSSRSNSRSKIQSNKKRSTSRERRRSRSLGRSISVVERERSRNQRDRSSHTVVRHDQSSNSLDHHKPDHPTREHISPMKNSELEYIEKDSRNSRGDGDLRNRIEMLKHDIKRHKMHLREQQMDDQDRTENDYSQLLQSEVAWQQLALEDENRNSGRLKYINDQSHDSNLWHSEAKPMYHESSLEPSHWSSREQSRSPARMYLRGKRPRSRSNSPINRLSLNRSPTNYDLYEEDCFIVNPSPRNQSPSQEQSHRAQCSPTDQVFSRTSRNRSPTDRGWNDATSVQALGSFGIDRGKIRSQIVSPTLLPEQTQSESGSVKERRQKSTTNCNTDESAIPSMSSSKSSSRCGSLDLEWPSSPCQPTSGAGRDVSLSPISSRFAGLDSSERQKIRFFATQRAQQVYSDRNNALGPSALDISSSFGDEMSIGTERQSLRALSGSLKMNRSAGFDWAQRSIDDFNIRELLGKGEFYDVHKAVDKRGQSVVVLRSVCADNASDGFRRPALRVIKMLSQLVHPNIVRLLEVIKDSTTCSGNIGKYFLSFEFCAYDLNSLLHGRNVKLLPEPVSFMFRQLLQALTYCHQRSIVHCDVRPCNILISAKAEVKLSYFCGAHIVGEAIGDSSQLLSSSLGYRSPEIILGAERWLTSVDMWSAGCVLGELMLGRPMFMASDELQQLLTICSLCGTPSLTVWPEVIKLPRYYMLNSRQSSTRCLLDEFANHPLEAVTMLDSLLVLNPSMRLPADAALNSRWLSGSTDSKSLATCLAAIEKSKAVSGESMGLRSIENFEFLCSIGSGNYGFTYKALDSTSNSLVILQTASCTRDLSEEASKLVAVHKHLNNPNILQLLETVKDSSKSATSHDLSGLLQASDITLTTSHIGCIFWQLLKALTFCHVKNIVHCDIRTCNVLITANGDVKLAGFGNARRNGDVANTNMLPHESLWYRAPELLLGADKFSPACDMWSCGCVLGEMLRRKPLFDVSSDELHQMLAITVICGTPSAASWPEVVRLPRFSSMKNWPQCSKRLVSEFENQPDVVVELLDALLTLNPVKRLWAFTALNGPWLKNLNVESIRATLPLPKSRDCRVVSKQRQTSSVPQVESTTSVVPAVLDPDSNKTNSAIRSTTVVSGSLKLDLSSAESMRKSLSTLLVGSKSSNVETVEEGPTKCSAINESPADTVHRVAQRPISAHVKTFVKLADQQKQQPLSVVMETNDHRLPQREIVIPPLAGDQDYRTEAPRYTLGRLAVSGNVPPATIAASEHERNDDDQLFCRTTSGLVESIQTESERGFAKSNQFWDEMAAYCATYEAKLSARGAPVGITLNERSAFLEGEGNPDTRSHQIHANSVMQPPSCSEYTSQTNLPSRGAVGNTLNEQSTFSAKEGNRDIRSSHIHANFGMQPPWPSEYTSQANLLSREPIGITRNEQSAFPAKGGNPDIRSSHIHTNSGMQPPWPSEYTSQANLLSREPIGITRNEQSAFPAKGGNPDIRSSHIHTNSGMQPPWPSEHTSEPKSRGPIGITRYEQSAFSAKEIDSRLGSSQNQTLVDSCSHPSPTSDFVSAALSRFREESSRFRDNSEENRVSIVSGGRQVQPSGLDSFKLGIDRRVPQHPGSSIHIKDSSTEQFRRFVVADSDLIGRSRKPGEAVMDSQETGEEDRFVHKTRLNMLVTVDNDRFRRGDEDGRDVLMDDDASNHGRLRLMTTRFDAGLVTTPSGFPAGSMADDEYATADDRGRCSVFSDVYRGSQRPPFVDANVRQSTMRATGVGRDYDDQRIVATPRDIAHSSSVAATAGADNESSGVEWRTLHPRY